MKVKTELMLAICMLCCRDIIRERGKRTSKDREDVVKVSKSHRPREKIER